MKFFSTLFHVSDHVNHFKVKKIFEELSDIIRLSEWIHIHRHISSTMRVCQAHFDHNYAIFC